MTAARGIGLALAALIGATLLTGCAETPKLDCTDASRPPCDAIFGPCPAPPDPCTYIPPGASNALVEMDSFPTAAAIFVNGDYIGKTPLKRYLWFSSTSRTVTVVAEPIYPGQARQEQRLQVPHLPRRLSFFMNNPSKTEGNTAETP